MDAQYTVIRNGTVLTPCRAIPDGVVVLDGAKILSVGRKGEVEEPPEAFGIDAGGRCVTPGLVDIHVHGSHGADVLDASTDALETMSRFFLTRGVTSFVATAITAPNERLLAALDAVRAVQNSGGLSGAEVLGVHQEGPFLNPAQKGAHPEELLVSPTPQRYAPFLEYADVMRSMTLAPELDGAVDLIRALREAGVVAACGHSVAIYREFEPAIEAGMTHAVHCFCNMGTLRRDNLKRVAGVVETVLCDDRLSTELIADGWHIGDVLMRLAVKAKGVGRVCLVTDAMTAAGMPPGRYFVGGVEAIVEDGIARLPDNTAYASSVTTLDVCVRNAVERIGLDLKDAVRMATLTPATVMGAQERKGSLEPGRDADVVIMDCRANVQMTIARGKVAYQAAEPAA
jgi:N-acetylglucosamine-6-phosphate deacetylase